MNLARSLLDACERDPEAEAFPGLRYGELLPRVRAHRRRPRASAPGARVAIVLDNRLETALLYWACQWAGAVCVPLSWRLSDDELEYCVVDSGADVVVREGDPLPDGAEHPGALDRDEREISLLLYTSGHDRPAEGSAALARADRAGGMVQALQHGYLPGDRTLGVMPLYHTMGIHSLARDAPRRRLLRPPGALGRRRGAAPDRGAADHVALPRADALPRPARGPSGSPGTTSRASARSATPARR